jgi:hypothetical protein
MNIENMLTNGMSGAAGSLLGGIFGAIGARKQYKRQKNLMKLQSQLEMDNWQQQFDAQNAYNDPSAQLDRLENAGINPLLQDGGFSNTSEAVSGASVGLPSPSVPDFSAFAEIGNNVQEAAFRTRELNQRQVEIENDTNRAIAQCEELYSRKDLNEENKLNLIENRKVIAKSVEESQSRIMSNYANTLTQLEDCARNWFLADTEKRYKEGLIFEQGRANDIASAGLEVKRQELKFQMDKWHDEFNLNVKKFNQAVKEGNFKMLSEALDKVQYEKVAGMITGADAHSLAIAGALATSLGANPDLLDAISYYGFNSDGTPKGGTLANSIGEMAKGATSKIKSVVSDAKDAPRDVLNFLRLFNRFQGIMPLLLFRSTFGSDSAPVDAITGAQ